MAIPMQYRDTNVRSFPLHPRFEKEKQQNHHQQHQQVEPAVEDVSSSTTTMQIPPYFDKETRQMMAMERLKNEFQDTFNYAMPRAIAAQVLKDIRSGLPAAFYTYAMSETLLAPRPSWRYTMAIIARLKRTRATVEDMDYRE